jgi:hypothetical protein
MEKTQEGKSMSDSVTNLYKLLGITDDRFQEAITPVMNGLCSRAALADYALMSIESNKDLQPHEKVYCAYAIGRACCIEGIKSKLPAPMQMFVKGLIDR